MPSALHQGVSTALYWKHKLYERAEGALAASVAPVAGLFEASSFVAAQELDALSAFIERLLILGANVPGYLYAQGSEIPPHAIVGCIVGGATLKLVQYRKSARNQVPAGETPQPRTPVLTSGTTKQSEQAAYMSNLQQELDQQLANVER
jgi:hypothetical protein